MQQVSHLPKLKNSCSSSDIFKQKMNNKSLVLLSFSTMFKRKQEKKFN